MRFVGTAVLRTDERRLSTQKPVPVLDLPAPIDVPDGESTVNRVPERLNVPFHLSLSATLVGRSNPAAHLETAVDELFFTTRVPHHPSFHLES